MNIAEIKKMMSDGDINQAHEILKNLWKGEQTDPEIAMLYGTCCHLLGDTAALAAIDDGLSRNAAFNHKRVYRKFHALRVAACGAAAALAVTLGGTVQASSCDDGSCSETYDGYGYEMVYGISDCETWQVHVYFNANGGSGSMATITRTIDDCSISVYTIPSCKFTRPGYSFVGWREKDECTLYSGDDYPIYYPGQEIELCSDVWLTAVWSSASYSVTLNALGGSGGTTSVSASYGSYMSSITVPTKTGYTFGGYYSAGNGGGTQYYNASGSCVHVWDHTSSSASLYAYWIPKTYSFSLDMQGGAGGTTYMYATYGSALSSITVPKRTGYTFGGYYTATNGSGTRYYDSNGNSAHVWDRASNAATLYAYWISNAYTLNLNLNGGVGWETSVTVRYGKAMPSVAVPSRTGYTFGGYYTTTTGSGTRYYDSNGNSAHVWDRASNSATLHAYWISNAYALTLNGNGGTGGQTYVSVRYGQAMPVVSVPSRTGYTFGGYYTTTTGSGTRYYDSNGHSVHVWDRASNAATLYAYWISNGYTVSLNLLGGSGGATAVYVRYGKAMPSISVPKRTGYTFGGYYTGGSGSGTRYYDSNGNSAHVWDRASNASTLYAYWIPNAYSVRLNVNGGTGGASQVTVRFGKSMPAVTKPSRTGYTFGGYYTTTTGTGMRYYDSNGNSAHVWDRASNSATLYAYWIPNGYTVTLNTQGGTGGSGTTQARYGKAMASIAKPSRTGYTFGGYYSATNGQGTRYYDSNGNSAHVWDHPSNKATLYAYWIANGYTVKFSANGGTGGVTSTTVRYGKAMPSVTKPTRAGYTFGGYYATTSGTGTRYYDSNGNSAHVWDRASNAVTLYAFWISNPYTVTLNTNGGTGGTTTVTARYGKAMPAVLVPTREGYVFGGYWTSPSGTGTRYYDSNGNSARSWDRTSNSATLYAYWIVKTTSYTVTLNALGGSGCAATVTAQYGSPMPSIAVPTRTGYTFGGFWTTTTGTGTCYYDAEGDSVHNWDRTSNAATLYAYWTANSYALSLNGLGGTGGDVAAVVTYGQKVSKVKVPTREGYTFGGYWTTTTGSGVCYIDASGNGVRAWDHASNGCTLYAYWIAK